MAVEGELLRVGIRRRRAELAVEEALDWSVTLWVLAEDTAERGMVTTSAGDGKRATTSNSCWVAATRVGAASVAMLAALVAVPAETT